MDRARTDLQRKGAPGGPATVIRFATAADLDSLERLAQRDSTTLPAGEVLVAERAGRVIAAIPLGGGSPVADPFQPTAGVVAILRLHREELDGPTPIRWWSRWTGARKEKRPRLIGLGA